MSQEFGNNEPFADWVGSPASPNTQCPGCGALFDLRYYVAVKNTNDASVGVKFWLECLCGFSLLPEKILKSEVAPDAVLEGS